MQEKPTSRNELPNEITFDQDEVLQFGNVTTTFELIEGNETECFFVENHSFEPSRVISWLTNYFTNSDLPVVTAEFPKKFFDLSNTMSVAHSADFNRFQNQDCVVLVSGYDTKIWENTVLLTQPAHHLMTQSFAECLGRKIFGKHIFIFLIDFVGWSDQRIIEYRNNNSSSQFSVNLPDFKIL